MFHVRYLAQDPLDSPIHLQIRKNLQLQLHSADVLQCYLAFLVDCFQSGRFTNDVDTFSEDNKIRVNKETNQIQCGPTWRFASACQNPDSSSKCSPPDIRYTAEEKQNRSSNYFDHFSLVKVANPFPVDFTSIKN